MSILATDIFRFEVKAENKPVDPMYGRAKLIYGEDELKDADTAIEKAKAYQKKHSNALVYAIANQYTSENNVKRHFALESHYIWHDWLDDAQVAGKRKMLGI